MRQAWLSVLGVSPLTIAKAVLQPQMIPTRILKWRGGNAIAALATLFPETTTDDILSLLHDLHANHEFYAEVNRSFVEKRPNRASCGGYREFLYVLIRRGCPGLS